MITFIKFNIWLFKMLLKAIALSVAIFWILIVGFVRFIYEISKNIKRWET